MSKFQVCIEYTRLEIHNLLGQNIQNYEALIKLIEHKIR